MFRLPFIFLVLALGAAFFGFGGISWDWAKVVCYLFLGLAGVSYVGMYMGRRFARSRS